MKTKRFTIWVLFATLLGLMQVSRAMAADLSPPQQAIERASSKLQQRLQDKSFTKDFAQIARFVNDAIYPHTDFDRRSRCRQ